MYLIIGGAGFLGRHLANKILASGEEVRIFDRAPWPPGNIVPGLEYRQGDIRELAVVEQACKGARFVFHLAAILPAHRVSRRSFEEVNVQGTVNVLESCLKYNISGMVYISSSSIYGLPVQAPITEETSHNPMDDYGRSKCQAEKYCRQYRQKGLPVAIVRPRTIIDEGRLELFQLLFERIKQGQNIYLIGSGDNLFQFVSAADLVEVCLLITKKRAWDDFNIGTDKFGTVRKDLAELINHAATGSTIVSLNSFLAKALLWSLDKIRLSPLKKWHFLTADKDYYFDITKAKNKLGWQPKDSNINLLIRSYDWYLKNGNSNL